MSIDDRVERIKAMTAEPTFNGDGPIEKVTRLGWDAVDLAPVLKGERVTLPPAVLARSDGVKLFYPGRTHIVMGETETAKTWLVLFAACQELDLGHHVMLLDYEDTVEMAVERLVTLGASEDDILALFSYYESPPPLTELGQELIRARCAERGQPTLVILDGVTEAMSALGLDPEKGTDVAKFYGAMPLWFAGLGAAEVNLDHVVKNTTNRGRWATGSQHKISGLTGAAYGMEIVGNKTFGRGRTGLAKVTVSKDRPGHVRQYEGSGKVIAMFELESWPDGKASARLEVPPVSDPDAPFRPTTIMERVSRALEDESPLSTHKVKLRVTGKAAYVDLALDLMVREGYLSSEPGPHSAVLYTSIQVFREP